MFKCTKYLLISISVHFFLISLKAAESVDLDGEIKRIKKELAMISSQRQSIRQETESDSKSHAAYKKILKPLENCIAEKDSIFELIRQYGKKDDSLLL